MRAGLLRETLTFKELTRMQSASGAIKKEYVEVMTCKARKVKASATRVDEHALEIFSENTVLFQVRNYPVLKEGQRVEYRGKEYDVKLLDWQNDNTYMVTLERVDK